MVVEIKSNADDQFNTLKIQWGKQINGTAIKLPKHTEIITKNLYASWTESVSSRPIIF